MTAVDGLQLVRRFFEEVWNHGRLGLIDELIDPEFINFGRQRGPQGLKVIVAVWRTAFPDLHMRIEDEVAAGETVVVRITCRGTHTAELRHLTMGVRPATGRQFSVEHIHMFKIRKGRIAEHRASRDDLGMLQQLHLSPKPEFPSELSRADLFVAVENIP